MNERIKQGKLSSIIGIFINICLFAIKLVLGFLTGALSITADAINNLSDALSSIITFVGFKLSEKPADADHPYGHARFEYISGIVVAAMVLFIGFEVAKSAVTKILHPKTVSLSLVAISLLVITIVVKIIYAIYCRKQGEKIHSTALKAAAQDSINDVLTTAAILIALLIGETTGWKADGYISLAVAVFIFYSGANLIKETIDPLLGHVGSDELRKGIADVVNSEELIIGHHDLMIHDYGPNHCFASIHVEIDAKEDVVLCHDVIDRVERVCEKELGVHLVIHYDPVSTDNEEWKRMKELSQTILKKYDKRLHLHDFRLINNVENRKVIFDVSLPDSLCAKQKEIQYHLQNEFEAAGEKVDEILVTFDPVEG